MPGAQSSTDGDLVSTRGGPSQEQVGYVGAGDQQNQAYRGKQQHQPGPGIPNHEILQRGHGYSTAGVGFGVLLGQPSADGSHVGLRLAHAYSRLQARHGKNAGMPAPRGEFLLRTLESERNEDIIHHIAIFEVLRQHSDHGVSLLIESNSLFDYLGVAAEPALPK